MLRMVSIFVVFFLAACSGGGSGSSSASPSPAASQSPAPSASPSASPSAVPNVTPTPTPTSSAVVFQDRDNDSISDADDNCPDVANADQADADNNGVGDVCEPALGPSCAADELALQWPFFGTDGRDWVVNNYVDLDDGPGLADYVGATGADARTVNTHTGTDIDVPSFRQMDADVPVLAAAAGSVVAVEDNNPDRNTVCSGDSNFVRVLHNNGFIADYEHLKRDSIVVRPGDAVQAGDMLAVVGSSGCSVQPHLHFELRNCDGNVVDPFLLGLWQQPPVYDTPLSLMDFVLTDTTIESDNDVKDPPANVSQVSLASTVGMGVSMAGGQAGDTITLQLVAPDGGTHFSSDIDLDRAYGHSFWFRNASVSLAPGTWSFLVRLNGQLEEQYEFEVSL